MTYPPICINRLIRSASYRMTQSHAHHTYELYFLISGTQKFFIEHTVYNMTPNDFAIIAPHTIHRTTFASPAGHERIMLQVSTDMLSVYGDDFLARLETFSRRAPITAIPADSQGEINALFTKVFAEYEKEDAFSASLLQNYIFEILSLTMRLAECQNNRLPSPGKPDESINKAAHYITQNYTKQLSLGEVADAASLSPAYFSAKFKAVTGLGFKEYLTYIRIGKAKQMLRHTDASITEISSKCGFSNSNYFGDLFYKATGLSPRAYRKQGEAM